MECTCDPRYNIAYLRLRIDTVGDVESIRISDEVVVDMAPDGTVHGIELLNTNAQLSQPNSSELVVVNEATGVHSALPLTGLAA